MTFIHTVVLLSLDEVLSRFFHLWVLKSRCVEVEMSRLKSWSKSYKNIWACIFTIVHTSLKFSYLQALVTLKKDVTPISNILIDVTFVMDTICL